MRSVILLTVAAFAVHNTTAQYASAVVNYTAGTGAASGFNMPASALGEPSRFTEHQFGGPVDPYDPPFLNSQIVSIGTGGSLTLQMSTPIRNDAANPYGLDFLVYGNSGFIITDFGAGTTDGTLFGAATPGSTRVSVSADNVQYFTIDMSLAPVVDSYFPTDGAGTFGLAVNPTLANAASFNGKTLDGIRALYAGSAGGAGFDLAWARNGNGDPVALDSVNYVKIEVLSGGAEIDGIAAVPEPSTYALIALGGLGMILRKRRS
jgi:hypothetical protein